MWPSTKTTINIKLCTTTKLNTYTYKYNRYVLPYQLVNVNIYLLVIMLHFESRFCRMHFSSLDTNMFKINVYMYLFNYKILQIERHDNLSYILAIGLHQETDYNNACYVQERKPSNTTTDSHHHQEYSREASKKSRGFLSSTV